MGTTAQKLQKLVENKQLIIDKVNNKAGTSFDINSKLGDVANAIENIESGIDTSDATATASDILKGKTAYTADGKVEGTIETYNGENDVGAVGSLKKLLDYTKATTYMFSPPTAIASSITYTDLTGYLDYNDVENVLYANYMFSGNTNIQIVPSLNFANLLTANNMFYNATALTNVGFLNTPKCNNMTGMFYGCSSLVNQPELDSSSNNYFVDIFRGCSNLKKSKLNTTSAIKFSNTYNGCKKLTLIDISYYNISNTSNFSYFVTGCFSLKALVIRSFGSNNTISSEPFKDCYHITGTTNSTYNPNGDKDGYIYVPRAKVNTLKSATNWSTYADQIRALEDYTLDGTTTGELNLTAMGLEA